MNHEDVNVVWIRFHNCLISFNTLSTRQALLTLFLRPKESLAMEIFIKKIIVNDMATVWVEIVNGIPKTLKSLDNAAI